MKKMILVSILTAFFIGCASIPEKRFVGGKENMLSISPLKAVLFKTAEIRQATLGRTLAGALTLGFGSDAIAKSGGESMKKEYSLPDIGQLVFRKFTETVPKAVPDWPEMVVEYNPVEKATIPKSGAIMVIRTSFIQVADAGTCYGICAGTGIQIFNPMGVVLWQTGFIYKSKDFGRGPESFSDLEKDGGKLLKEEMNFAAGKTAEHFIEHFIRGGESGN